LVALLAPGAVWLGIFVVVPLGFTIAMSFWKSTIFGTTPDFQFGNYRDALESPLYLDLLWKTLRIGIVTTLISLVLSYPIAYFLSMLKGKQKTALLLLLFMPFWTSYVVRTFVWLPILGRTGAINELLRATGLISEPLPWLIYNEGAIYLGLVYVYTLFMTLPIYLSIEDRSASDRGGDRPRRAARMGLSPGHSILELARHHCRLLDGVPARRQRLRDPATFGRAVGNHVQQHDRRAVPLQQQLGDGSGAVGGPVGRRARHSCRRRTLGGHSAGLHRREGLMSSAAQKMFAATPGFRIALWIYAVGFYVFLYAPLLMIAVLSVNNSPIVGFPLQGFTLRRYQKVFETNEFLSAASNSFAVGAIAALVSTGLALLLGLGFRRKFPLKSALFNLVLMPIVMPGIVGGIVLLLFFGYLNVRPSLYTTVLIAHINWVLPFAFLTLYPRVHNFDNALEEAAMDLGARPHDVFVHVVFPIIRPAFIATTLFSFSLSFDEFVRTLFVTGYDRTIPVMFWSMIVDQLAPELPAMAVVIILISATMSLVGALVSHRANARAQYESGQ